MGGDGFENVTSKVNSHSFKLYRAYFIYVNSSNVQFQKNCIEVQEKKRKSESHFSRRSGAVTATQYTKIKSVMHVQSCMFCQYKLIAFTSFSLKSPSSLLKFRNIVLVGAAINVYKLVSSSKLSQKFLPSLFARRSRTRASKLNFPFPIVC